MAQKGPEFARAFLTAELGLDSYLVAFTGGTLGSVITTTDEAVADVEAKSGVAESTALGRPKSSGSGATAWIVGTASGVTRARNTSAIPFSQNTTGSQIDLTAIAMVVAGHADSVDISAANDDSRIRWYVNLGSVFVVPDDRTPQIPASTADFLKGMVIQEA